MYTKKPVFFSLSALMCVYKTTLRDTIGEHGRGISPHFIGVVACFIFFPALEGVGMGFGGLGWLMGTKDQFNS